jgi:hypothetical protein
MSIPEAIACIEALVWEPLLSHESLSVFGAEILGKELLPLTQIRKGILQNTLSFQ